MSNNIENASFILRTCDIVDINGAVIADAIGTRNDPYCADLTFQNVNLKDIIGTNLWNKYDFFSLSLIAVPSGYQHQAVTHATADTGNTIYMSGLNWINCNYNYANKTNRTRAMIGTMIENNTDTVINWQYQRQNETNCNLFSKGNNIVDIRIELFRTKSGVLNFPTNAGFIFPQMVLFFCIQPVKLENVFSSINLATTDVAVSGSRYKWSSYDIKTSIGELWNYYETFNLELTQIIHELNSATTINSNGASVMVCINGLPFVNKYKSNPGICHLCNFANGVVFYAQPFGAISITNTQPQCDIEISFYRVDNGAEFPSSLKNFTLQFKVTGLKKKIAI